MTGPPGFIICWVPHESLCQQLEADPDAGQLPAALRIGTQKKISFTAEMMPISTTNTRSASGGNRRP